MLEHIQYLFNGVNVFNIRVPSYFGPFFILPAHNCYFYVSCLILPRQVNLIYKAHLTTLELNVLYN